MTEERTLLQELIPTLMISVQVNALVMEALGNLLHKWFIAIVSRVLGQAIQAFNA
jgi:hypothetical protein